MNVFKSLSLLAILLYSTSLYAKEDRPKKGANHMSFIESEYKAFVLFSKALIKAAKSKDAHDDQTYSRVSKRIKTLQKNRKDKARNIAKTMPKVKKGNQKPEKMKEIFTGVMMWNAKVRQATLDSEEDRQVKSLRLNTEKLVQKNKKKWFKNFPKKMRKDRVKSLNLKLKKQINKSQKKRTSSLNAKHMKALKKIKSLKVARNVKRSNKVKATERTKAKKNTKLKVKRKPALDIRRERRVK